MGLLDGKTVLVTGVLTDSSIAFHVARLAQQEGADVVLTSFGRQMRITTAISRRLPKPTPIVELDVTSTENLDALAGAVRQHAERLDGVVHSIGFAPQGAFDFILKPFDLDRFIELIADCLTSVHATNPVSTRSGE